MILLTIIVAQHSALKIAIMTPTPAAVHCFIRAAGGTTLASTQTSMVCTSRVNHLMKEFAGTSGKKMMNPSRGPR